MAKRRSNAETRRKMAQLPEVFLKRVLPGAAKAGATVIAEEAKHLLGDRHAETGAGTKVLIADGVKVRVRRKGDTIRARVMLTGPGSYVGKWLEYGTDPHFITVDDSQRQGMTARRINRLDKEARATGGSLVIGGQFVGSTVHHPGARAHPFMRPALDMKQGEALAAAQAYITTRRGKAGLAGADDAEGGDA